MDLTHAEEKLVEEFAGIFSPETVAECLRDCPDKLSGAPVQTYVALLSCRFTRDTFRITVEDILADSRRSSVTH